MVWNSPCNKKHHSIEMNTYKFMKIKICYENNLKKITHELQKYFRLAFRVIRYSLGGEVKGISWRGKNMGSIVFQKTK